MIEQTFEEAVAEFGNFLVSQGWSGTVAWVFRDAATRHRRRLFIDIHATLGAEADAAVAFEEGRKRGLGIRLEAIALAGGVTFAIVGVPQDEADASAMMMTGRLRFVVRTSATQILLTQHRWWFALVRSLDRLRGGAPSELPTRPTR